MDLEREVVTYIRNEIAGPDVSFKNDESLFDRNILDSLRTIQLMGFLQDKLGFTIDPLDVRIEDFETVNSIVSYLKTVERTK